MSNQTLIIIRELSCALRPYGRALRRFIDVSVRHWLLLAWAVDKGHTALTEGRQHCDLYFIAFADLPFSFFYAVPKYLLLALLLGILWCGLPFVYPAN